MLGLLENDLVKKMILDLLKKHRGINIDQINEQLLFPFTLATKDCLRALIKERKVMPIAWADFTLFSSFIRFSLVEPNDTCRHCKKPYLPGCCERADNYF